MQMDICKKFICCVTILLLFGTSVLTEIEASINILREVDDLVVKNEKCFENFNDNNKCIHSLSGDNLDKSAILPPIDLSDTINPTMRFATQYNITPPIPMTTDSGIIKISIDEGKTWETIRFVFGDVPYWSEIEIPLITWKNEEILLCFQFKTGRNSISNGWYIDNIYFEDRGLRLYEQDFETFDISDSFGDWMVVQKERCPDIWVDDCFNEKTPGWNKSHFNSIKNALDNSEDGFYIRVSNGCYYENDLLFISKSISLIGEDKNQTIIRANMEENGVLFITADFVNLSGFQFSNYTLAAGLSFLGDSGFDYTQITDNILLDGAVCYFNNSQHNLFAHNLISNSSLIIREEGNNDENYIKENNFRDSEYGVILISTYPLSNPVNIINNNFINNTISAIFSIDISLFSRVTNSYLKERIHYLSVSTEIMDAFQRFRHQKSWNFIEVGTSPLNVGNWDHNYWDDWRGIGPKFISGFLWLQIGTKCSFSIPWFQFDWHPAQEPYDIL